MAKKDKKVKKVDPDPAVVDEELLLATTDLEAVREDVQYTDTSYTSASFETLPSIVFVEEPKPKRKKDKKKIEVLEDIKQPSEFFVWSEDELPILEEQQKIVEEESPKEKKGGKKKKKKEVKEEIPDFPRPKDWKKMNKKERQAWLEQQMEEWRIQKEAEKQAQLASVKERRATAAKERLELMASDNVEQETRRDLLANTVALFAKFERQKKIYSNEKQKEAEWCQYLRCDGLPDPRVVTQMNTYLHLWREKGICDDKELEKRCLEALPMLEMLEEFVANSRQYTQLQAQGYNEVRLALRQQLSHAIEYASYSLLRNLEENLTMESIKLGTYQKEFKGLLLNIWVTVRMPTRKPKAVEVESEPVDLQFPAMKVSVKLPRNIDTSNICVRAARSLLDLFSENSRTFHLINEMPDRYQDLFIFNVQEHVETYNLNKEQEEVRSKFYKETNQKIKELEAWLKANVYTKNKTQEDELDNLNLAEPPFLPDPRTYIGEQNEISFKKYLQSCQTRTRAGEINLRKYRICGGILHLDLLMSPPQPKRMMNDIDITTLFLPKKLHPKKYQVQYRAPGPPPAGVTRTPEEIEAEMKKIEAEYEKLALVNIEVTVWRGGLRFSGGAAAPPCQYLATPLSTLSSSSHYSSLPDNVVWLEPPVVCQWQENRQLWTSNYVNDYKYNEDKFIVQFRTGVLWPIGLATLRYSNIPFQGWDLRPDPNGKGVLIQVTGLGATVGWECKGNYVKLKYVTNINTIAFKEYLNKRYSVKKMVQIMQEASCDFFPDFDSHNHVEGSCPKEWVMERHNYHAMAFLSRAYNFQWSRWNVAAGYRNIVMQIREAVDKKREAKLELLYLTPQRAQILKCDEMSQEFSREPLEGIGFHPDLFTLNMSYGSVDARRQAFAMKYQTVETVFEMLQELKLCSYS